MSILEKQWLSGNMIRLVVEKPRGYEYHIGQAVELAIDKPEYQNNFAPFTLTSLPDSSYLEFIIKVYPANHGLTLAMAKLSTKTKLLVSDAWDSYRYDGPGTFIAGGSGITPFIPMLRDLHHKGRLDRHLLINANKTSGDIVLQSELEGMLNGRFINILSQENNPLHDHGTIDLEYLTKTIGSPQQKFYLCGPPGFSEGIKDHLLLLGVREKNIQIGY